MHGPKTSLHGYAVNAKRENYAQFRGDYSNGANSFIIAAHDARTLLAATHGHSVDNVPGYSKSDAVILTLGNNHKELYLDPRLRGYRDVHLAFFEAIGAQYEARDLIGKTPIMRSPNPPPSVKSDW